MALLSESKPRNHRLPATGSFRVLSSDIRRKGDLAMGKRRGVGVVTKQLQDRDFFFRAYVLLSAVACGIGGAILMGGGDRFSGPSFAGPRNLVGWLPFFDAWVYWGILFLGYGLAMGISAKRKVAIHVLRFGIVTYTFLAITFTSSLFVEPTAAATGCAAYLGFAVLCLLMSDHLERHGWEE